MDISICGSYLFFLNSACANLATKRVWKGSIDYGNIPLDGVEESRQFWLIIIYKNRHNNIFFLWFPSAEISLFSNELPSP